MAKGRPTDPKRATRKTGNRPLPNEAKKVKPVSPIAIPVPPEAFPPPATLPSEVHEVWRAVVSDLGGANHMRPSFIPAITAYCEAVYVHAQASANIQQFGILVKGQNGVPIANPLLRVQKDASATMLRYAETLGLTPAARIRLGLMEITGASLLSSLNTILDGK
jgi:P27 family predicted phage terminase small subunit